MPRKVFVAGEILTAADVNTNLMDQAVMVFDDSAARGSAIPTPSEGMVTYLKDTNLVEAYTGAAFEAVSQPGILQVLSTTKTNIFSVSSTSFVDVTDMSVAITPTTTSSKILVMVSTNTSSADGNITNTMLQLVRDSTAIFIGDAAGSRTRASFSGNSLSGTVDQSRSVVLTFLDAPATTSAITYKLQIRGAQAAGNLVFVNRSEGDADNDAIGRIASSITVMEVAG